jgi:hypothetical protein
MGKNWIVPSRKELDDIVEDEDQIESIKIKI